MATVTNKHGAPESLVAFAKQPHYDSEGSTYTVTQLIDSPRVRILRAKHADEIEDDVSENIFRLVGTSIHKSLEWAARYPTGRFVVEERIAIKHGDKKISGAIDIQINEEDIKGIVIGDYKFTSVSSIRFLEKYEKQLNLLALIHDVAKPREWPVKRLEVYAILRDWSFRSAQRDRSYPQTPLVTIQIDLWDKLTVEEYYHQRVAKHEMADLCFDRYGTPPSCDKEDMWEKDPKYAVKRPDRKRAIRVLDSAEEAEEYMEENGSPSWFVEKREGERTRCENFCDVSQFCDQWKEYKNGK